MTCVLFNKHPFQPQGCKQAGNRRTVQGYYIARLILLEKIIQKGVVADPDMFR